MTDPAPYLSPEAPPRPTFWDRASAVWNYVFPALEMKTDRVVRRLIIADLIALAYATVMARDPATVFIAFIAASAIGAIGGLLFAVPKQAQLGTNQTNAGQTVAIIANTSLEEVSDWLTKTIIGAGLVSWRQILAQLDISGKVLGQAMTNADPNLSWAAGVGLILGPAGLGALISYLWFARHWPSELAGTAVATHDTLNSKRAAVGLQQELKPAAPEIPNLPPPPPADKNAPAVPAAGVRKVSELAGEAVPGPNSAAKLRQAAKVKYRQMLSAPLHSDDWVRGMFRGMASVTGPPFGSRKMSASVRKLDADWFEVSIEIAANPRPETEAIFFLHNTFPQPTPSVGFDADGVARLKVTAYGAFTVGALTDDGTTELELNLAELDSAPSEFRNR